MGTRWTQSLRVCLPLTVAPDGPTPSRDASPVPPRPTWYRRRQGAVTSPSLRPGPLPAHCAWGMWDDEGRVCAFGMVHVEPQSGFNVVCLEWVERETHYQQVVPDEWRQSRVECIDLR